MKLLAFVSPTRKLDYDPQWICLLLETDSLIAAFWTGAGVMLLSSWKLFRFYPSLKNMEISWSPLLKAHHSNFVISFPLLLALKFLSFIIFSHLWSDFVLLPRPAHGIGNISDKLPKGHRTVDFSLESLLYTSCHLTLHGYS